MTGLLTSIFNTAVVVFVVCSMLAMGLSLTVRQIGEPLRDARLVVLALVANYVLVPLLALLLLAVIPLGEGHAIGLILLAMAAGAPFLPKLVQMAKGNIALSVGLMVLLIIVTLVYLPVVLPLLLPGVSVDPLAIARSLATLILPPLLIGLFIRARFASTAARLQPIFLWISNLAFAVIVVTVLLLHWRTLLEALGDGTFVTAVLFILVSLAIGYVMAGHDTSTRKVLALGTAQRNRAAALVVAGQNFTDPDVLVMVVVGSVLMLLILVPLAGVLGRRAGARRNEGRTPA